MIADRWPEISRVLDEVLDRPATEWSAVLDDLCGSDYSLRQEVEALLSAHERLGDFMETPPLALAAGAVDLDDREIKGAGWTVGPYRVVRLIARGGMGRVMLAERADGAFAQQVAIKLLRPGADTPDAEWRFRTERQILATVHHPNIAHLFDGGVTPDGQPWLAMEYVEGLPIDRYAAAQKLGLPDRLDLVLTVAGAVQFAHGKLVIHRDLKPANILVTDTGQPKLLDFGIAKLLSEEEGTDSGPLTRTGQRWMTPAYAAPEQIRGEPATTATDVYQLGAVLYELLTGQRPFDAAGDSVRAIENAVLTQDPTRPSDTTGRSPASPAWAGDLRGDLDAIVLKALRKEPERRYGSVEAMADDIRRYLAHEPVLARENTVGYRMRRFVDRHRVGVAAAAAFVVLLASAAVALAVQQADTARERDRATAAAAKATQVTDYLMGMFEAADPGQALGDTITARELLERGVLRADALTDQPAVQSTLLGVTGRVYASLGEYDRAVELLRRAVVIARTRPERDETELTDVIYHLAATLELQEAFEESAQLYDEVVSRASAGLGDRTTLLHAQFGLGYVQHVQHQTGAADSMFAIWEAALDTSGVTFTPELARRQIWLGQMMQYRGELARAERLLRRALATHRELYGKAHPQLGVALHALASVLLASRSTDAADSVTYEAVALQRSLNPAPHRPLAQSLAYRAELLQQQERYVDAEAAAREAQAISDTLFGQDHMMWDRSTMRLAHILYLQGRNAEAEELYRGRYAWWVEQRGRDYPFTVAMASRLATVLLAREKYAEAEALMLSSHDIFRRDRGEDDPATKASAARLVTLYEAWGKPELAARYTR